MDLIKNIKIIEEQIIKWRRDLHKIPEIGNDLPLTVAYVKKVLDEIGVEYHTNFSNDSSVLVTIKGGKGNSEKCIALRADMDGLPMEEYLDLPFKAENGNMHACGHDAHTAIMLGVIKSLNEMKDSLDGTVKILLQPGEETNSGAEPMIQGGALEGVDFIVGLHVGNISDEMADGQIGVKAGPLMACMDKFTIDVYGKSSHGAYPHGSIDPVVISSHIITALQEIVARELDPIDSAVISSCIVNGGSAFNIIPDHVQIVGASRSLRKEVREYIAKRIGEIAEGVASAFRGRVEYVYSFGPPPLTTDAKITEFARQSAIKAVGEENVMIMQKPVMGGEDFAYYLDFVPGTYVFVKNPLYVDGIAYPHHNGKFGLEEKHFVQGLKFFVQTVVDYLG